MINPEKMSEKNDQEITNNGFSLEKMREKISQRIEVASSNPIVLARLAELENELNKFTDHFINIGHRDAAQITKENDIEKEILQSSAIADNIIEFKEMLNQLSAKYGVHHNWIEKFLAHENAHASVAQATGHEWVGYAALFIKDEFGNLSSIQPLCFTKPNPKWGPKEAILKNIKVTYAPQKYGDQLSESDLTQLECDIKRIRKISSRLDLHYK